MKPADLLARQLEHDKPSALGGFNSAWKFVEQNCSDILALYQQTGEILYRGVKKRHRRFFLASLEIIGE